MKVPLNALYRCLLVLGRRCRRQRGCRSLLLAVVYDILSITGASYGVSELFLLRLLTTSRSRAEAKSRFQLFSQTVSQ